MLFCTDLQLLFHRIVKIVNSKRSHDNLQILNGLLLAFNFIQFDLKCIARIEESR